MKKGLLLFSLNNPCNTRCPLFLLPVVWACCCIAVADTLLQDAAWLRDPVFDGVPVLNLFHREKDPQPELSGPTNVHTLFREEVVVRENPTSATLIVTGDDYFKLYINGTFVTQGPAPSYYFAHPCLELDVTPFLRSGLNCLAAHVYYQGLCNRVWNSADNRSGFALSMILRFEDGSTEHLATDGNWRCFTLDAFEGGDTLGYKTQFPENIDLRRMPRGWQEVGFDDKDWQAPLSGHQDHTFVYQVTPPLQITRRNPSMTQRRDEDRYFYDFGQNIVGCTRIRVQGKKGHKIRVRHGEELLENGDVRFEMRANCRYEEKCILSGESDLIEFYDYRAFRYIEILDAPAEPEVWVDVRHHPFNADRVQFHTDNPLLQGTWDICRNGVVMGSQDVFVDCPSREKGQYLGDAVITARSHLWLTADASLTCKAIRDFTHSNFIHQGLMAVAPGNFMQEIAEYSLQFPLLLSYYLQLTGDLETVRCAADAVFEGLFGYFKQYENSSGLLAGMSKENSKWVLVDWPKNLRDDYDYEYSLEHGNTVLNGFYYGALRTAAELERVLGRDGAVYDARADLLEQSFAQHLVNPDTGLYVDAPGSKHSSLHANAVPLFFGLTAGANRDAMLAHIRDKRLSCGVYIASYVIEACFKAGAADLAFSLLTSTDEHSWNEMLKNGATTCMEAWGPEQKNNTSWLHPWSSSPIYLIAEHVFGLSPGEPGWSRIRIAPPEIQGLPAMELTLPLPGGRQVTASYHPGKGYDFMTPEGIPVDNETTHSLPVRIVSDSLKLAPAPERLQAVGWMERVGTGTGLWVSVPLQRAFLIQAGQPVTCFPCATARRGVGSKINSEQTPPGWHCIAEKIGGGEPEGRIFRSRQATAEIWRPGMASKEDLVLSRVLPLEGLERGVNQGADAQGVVVDSRKRHIYIHGTNDEEHLGSPSSHGCVRLSNRDVMSLFEQVNEGTLVYIES